MKAWDIYTGDRYGPHPCVLISCQARIDAKPQVVVLKCTSMQPGQERQARENEVVLDRADGLYWKTLCRCDLLFAVDKSTISRKRGSVTPERRRAIARKIIQGLAIAGL
jgi:mRNA-degrading endonuclease toxin of MazEF toxin-antitoxin module